MGTDSNSPTPPAASPPSRRTFFWWLTYGLGTVAAAAAGLPLIGYFLGPRKAPILWFPLGPVEEFPQTETRRVTFVNPIRQPWDGMVANTGVYVRYEGRDDKAASETKGYKFLIFAANCAHLGCPVEWFQESGLFMCPCHGGVYYANGERASGPPPRGLFRCAYRITDVSGLDVLEIQAPHYPTLHDTLLSNQMSRSRESARLSLPMTRDA